MPKYRKNWTKTLDSFDFNEMPDDFCRVVWLLLPLIVDGDGRGIDLPAWVCSRMFPLRRVEEADITRAFDYFTSRKMIVRYTVGGRSYFYIAHWTSYQSGTEKEAASVLPPPPDKVESRSGVGPESVETKSAWNESASAYESVNASESDAPPAAPVPPTPEPEFVDTPFTRMSALVSNKIHLTRENTDPDMWDGAINQLVTDDITENDIDTALKYLRIKKMKIVGAQSIVKSCAIAKGDRLRNAEVPPDEPHYAEVF